MSAIGSAPTPLTCPGDTSGNVPHSLADGNQIAFGTLKISPPKCINSALSGIDAFLLNVSLKDQPSKNELSTASGVLADVQVGAGP